MSNKQQDLQNLSFFDIFKESIKLILTWPKIFLQISLISILPSSCIFLFDNLVYTFQYNNQAKFPRYNDILGSNSKELFSYTLIKVIFFIFSTVLSLISISTVVYTVACIYANETITFKRIISVVPKVWKSIVITQLGLFCGYMGYSLILVIWVTLSIAFDKLKTYLLIGILIYMVGLIYLSMIWYLSYPISILEKIYGFKAMKKSKVLINGKKGITMGILLVLIVLEIPIIAPKIIEQLVGFVVVKEEIWYRIFCVVWSTLITLFALVNQCVFYFVCKSYHHDNIEKPLLVDNLEGYLGEYVPIKIENK